MKFGILTFVYTLLLDMVVFYSFAMKQNEIIYEFNQRMQDIQVNYATDAAAWMMLYDTPDIDIDYTTMSDIKVSPEVALKTYEAVMVRGLGWADTEETRAYFEDVHMPFFIVAAYDGYYVYGVTKDIYDMTLNDKTTKLSYNSYPKMWTPKIPYAEYFGADSTKPKENIKYINMYTLGDDFYERITIDGGNIGTVNYSDMTPDVSDDTAYAKTTHRDILVASELTDACQKALFAAKNNVDSQQIIIPSSFSQWSSNRPVEYPTVLTYMDVAGDMTKFNHVSFAIGGSRIEEGNYYIAYLNDKGAMLYAHSRYRKDVETKRGLKVIAVYNSAIECAQNQYYFDVTYLQ